MPRPAWIVMVAILGCGGDGSDGTGADAGRDAGPAPPLEECVVGTWARSVGECNCDFDPNPEGRTRECDHADCTEWHGSVIAEDGAYAIVPSLRTSETAGTASVPYGCVLVVHYTWSIADDELVLHATSSDRGGPTTCDHEELRHMPTGRWTRAPERLVPVLLELAVAEVATETCHDLPY